MKTNRFAISSAAAIASLAAALASLPQDAPLLIHIDLLRLGLPDGALDRDQISEGWLTIIQAAAGGRTLLIPTFNYDYTRTRRYDPALDPGQVGSLSAHCARRYPERRTLTPVFNFCVFGDRPFDRAPVADPFSMESAFGRLFTADGAILFLGVGMIANTFVHFVETAAGIGYRYQKPFPGSVIVGDRSIPIDFRFPVRPRVADAVIYGDLGEAALAANGLLQRFTLGLSGGLMVRARAYHDLVRGQLAQDELCLLTPPSRKVVSGLYERFGHPLTLAAMEPA